MAPPATETVPKAPSDTSSDADLDVTEIARLAENARRQLAHVATRTRPPKDNLGSYFSEDWVPPIAPGENVPVEDRPFDRRDSRRTLVLVLLVGISALFGVAVVGPKIVSSRSEGFTTTTISQPVGMPSTDEDAALLAVEVGTQLLKGRNYGTVMTGRARPAESWTLDYLLKADTETFVLGESSLLNGVEHAHILGNTRAGALAASWPNNAQTREALTKAINGEFPIELWIGPEGNLAKMTVHTLDNDGGTAGLLEIVYAAAN